MSEEKITKSGKITSWLSTNGFNVGLLDFDHQGIEMIKAESDDLLAVSLALYSYGFNYLRCQFAYDSAPGADLVSVYYLVKVTDNAVNPEEICLKVFVPRNKPQLPSVFWIWKTADFQERESFDMFGIYYENHPHLKRILMPENWRGWPLRKDYITPDFYELQDAY